MAKNYVNNPDFLQALIDYKAKCRECEEKNLPMPMVTNYIGECIFKISYRLASRPNFASYTYKEEMIADGLENAIQAIGNFNPDKSNNPFAYFTQIIWNAFLRRIEKEQKQMYIKHKVTELSMIHGTAVDKNQEDSGDAAYIDLDNDYMSNFVENYEAKLIKKKKVKESKKVGITSLFEEK
jgi:DNA-directed RNA polymerase specialized sigma subunit